MKTLKTAIAVLFAGMAAQAAAVGGMVDVNVFDRSEGRNLPVYWHEGRAYVVGKPGNEYQIAVRSRQGDEVLAVMSVDGVNVVTGETANPQQSGYVLAPGRALEVKGWRKDLSRTAAFYFTSLPDSYAARTGRPDNVGALGVALFRKRQEPQLQPYSGIAPRSEAAQSPLAREKSNAAGSMADQGVARMQEREDKLGTGHGRNEASYARQVAFERATSEPAETVVIYYDSYRNLLARGIIPRATTPRQPAPNPFPGFVADPPA